MKTEVIESIIQQPIPFTTSKWIIEPIPFLFENNLEKYINWKQRLSDLIGVDSKAIVFTGSSCVGFSLNPSKNFRDFDDESDIDVAVISDLYFDIAWHFLRNLGPQYYRFGTKEKNAIDDHRKRLVYHGTIATDKIIQILPFGKDWITAMNEMSKLEPTKDREINFRIYKDFEALKSYQSMTIGELRDKLLKN